MATLLVNHRGAEDALRLVLSKPTVDAALVERLLENDFDPDAALMTAAVAGNSTAARLILAHASAAAV